MADSQGSPMTKILNSLGMTREELAKRSDQMRQFLTADDDAPASRVLNLETTTRPLSGSDLQSNSKSTGSSRSLARSLSRASSSSLRDGTPPTTPIKCEPHDAQIPHRRMDSMEMVIERQRRQRKTRRDRERESSRHRPHPPSPSPSNASQSGHSLDSFMYSRDEPKTSTAATSESGQSAPSETSPVGPPPVTPQKHRYYRDHTNLSAQSQARQDGICKTETPTPTRAVIQAPPQNQPLPQYYAYPAYVGYSHYLPLAYRALQAGSSSTVPITPQAQRIQAGPSAATLVPPPNKTEASPLPPSSPPPASSPMSSPVRRVVNLVSSPGPMGPEPEETEYDNLPYKLPPGPYLSTKPDLSYAALIGRAVLSSSNHRLTLQEIYDWITIVYPYYKRGETTWMNSIRHVLSTTVVFRKVPRDRSVGRTLWAIYDEDLECFKDGGFKKQLCKDYANPNDSKEKSGGAKGKGKSRKRVADNEDSERKPKKAKKEQAVVAGSSTDSSVVHSSFLAQKPLGTHPLFPATRPTPHLQPYYQSLLPQPQAFPTVPADVIFPPLPSAAFSRGISSNSLSSSSSITKADDASTTDTNNSPPSTLSRSSPAPPTISSASSFSSTSSVPDLTPNRNSSSPPSSLPATSDVDVDMHGGRPSSAGVYRPLVSAINADPDDEQDAHSSSSADADGDAIFNTSLLGPVKFWRHSPKNLQPGIELMEDSDEEVTVLRDKKGKKKEVFSSKNATFPPMPASPTLGVLSVKAKAKANAAGRSTTPVPSTSSIAPSTPTRSTTHKISSVRTPISHKGLHMSPSTSLAHYKSNLDPPPPAVTGGVAPLDVSQAPNEDDGGDPMRTPRKRASTGSALNVFGQPMTPKKLIFTNMTDSPFRTPSGASPFRTPRSRAYDPHDPRTLLDDELNRMSYSEDSPAGLFGKERSSLLYDSPGLEGYKWW